MEVYYVCIRHFHRKLVDTHLQFLVIEITACMPLLDGHSSTQAQWTPL